MTQHEKAEELINKFNIPYRRGKSTDSVTEYQKINCAIVCVDEILNNIPMYQGNINPKYTYFQEVKQILQSKL